MDKLKDYMCVECEDRPVHIKKRGLCTRCYERFQRKQRRLGRQSLVDETKLCEITQAKRQQAGEIEFIRNFFRHLNWVYQPAVFHLNGTNYTPDFFDKETGRFIEVSATRQAYHANKEKYQLFRQLFPSLTLEIRKPNGKIVDENGRIDWS